MPPDAAVPFDRETLAHLWPHGDSKVAGLIDGIVDAAPAVFPKYGIAPDNKLVISHVMAQFSHECDAGLEMVENLNYSADGLIRTWPKHFNRANAYLYAHNPQKIANYIYEPPRHTDLGNHPNSDDGWNFRGRGLPQTTGREGYARLSQRMGIDLTEQPDLVNNPQYALECGVADFINCGCLPFAERDDVLGVTHHLNGGTIGLEQRKSWLRKWKLALHVGEAAPVNDGTLRYGASGFEVVGLQNRLTELGYPIGAADGEFGPTTRKALLGFQADNGLPTTGILDQATKDAMISAPKAPLAEERVTATADDLREDGSTTILSADRIKTVGKVAGGSAVLAGGDKAGVLDSIKEWAGQYYDAKPILDSLKPLLQWSESHMWIILLVGGALVWYFGADVIKSRLADHREGKNLGR